MSADEDKIRRWWDIIKSSNLKGALGRVSSWDDLVQFDQLEVKKAYRAAAKLDNLSRDRSGMAFIGKIPEGHSLEFIVRSDRTAALKATPENGGDPIIYELGGGFDWQDIKKVATMPAPVIVTRKFQGTKSRTKPMRRKRI